MSNLMQSPSTGSIDYQSVPIVPGKLPHGFHSTEPGIGQKIVRQAVGAGQRMSQHVRTPIEHRAKLDIYSEPDQPRKSSIICTIGPKTNSVEKLTALRQAGMNIVRLNFSHGSYEFHQSIIDNIRKSCELYPGAPVAIALDTKGPEIRTGMMKAGVDEISVKEHQEITISVDPKDYENGDDHLIFCDYKNLPKLIKIGNLLYVDDGLLSLKVTELGDSYVKTIAMNPAKLGSRKGVNLPDIRVDLPALSEKDKKDLEFGVQNDVDMIFASFIRKAQDVRDVRAALGEKGKRILIISKIENHEGVQNFAEILKETDGVMVARGDLGIEIPSEKVFLAQKMMIAQCNIAAKPVICATQMLESMTYNPRPTRAEISDVANAVLDGADCVMLSGETAKGNYPIETVTIMHKICREAESAIFYRPLFEELRSNTPKPTPIDEAVASSAVNAAFETEARAIIALTTSGNTARLLAKYHPSCPVITVTRSSKTSRQVHLYRGSFPLHYNFPIAEPWQDDVNNRFNWAMEQAKIRGFLAPGDIIVGIQGWRGGPMNTNTMRIFVCP